MFGLQSLRHFTNLAPFALIKRTLVKCQSNFNNSSGNDTARPSDKMQKRKPVPDYPRDPTELLIKTTTVKHSGNKHSATLFLFHGSGSSGDDFKQWLDILNREPLKFSHIKIVYVTAPVQPYTPRKGEYRRVWFDRYAISINALEISDSINMICHKVSGLIHREISDGIPINRIVVGGFSMGGSLAFHLAYRIHQSVAGCLVMSSFLNRGSSVFWVPTSTDATSETKYPRLLQFHGTADKIVPLIWGKKTFDSLQKLGIQGSFVPLEGADHEIVQTELNYVKDWLSTLLPAINETRSN